MHLTRAVLPIMVEQSGGSIVNIASDAAKVATPGESVLGAAMAAIVMFSRVTAIEAKRDGIRVNVITPSLIAGTPTAEAVLQDGTARSSSRRPPRWLTWASPSQTTSPHSWCSWAGPARPV